MSHWNLEKFAASNVPKGHLELSWQDSMLSGLYEIYRNRRLRSIWNKELLWSATAFCGGIAEESFIEELLPQVVVAKL